MVTGGFAPCSHSGRHDKIKKITFSSETISGDEEIRKGPVDEGDFEQWFEGSEVIIHIKSYLEKEHSKQRLVSVKVLR